MDAYQMTSKILAMQLQSLQNSVPVDWTEICANHSDCQCIFCTDEGFDLDHIANDSFALENDLVAEFSH